MLLTAVPLKTLAQKLRSNDARALARGLTLCENDPVAAQELLDLLPVEVSPPIVIGITGAPGTGKSTLVRVLLREAVASFDKIAVLAVDPSSPLSGGALLGDRLRMMSSDMPADKVFIRSMAARGHLGGVSTGTALAIQLLGRCGYERIFVETVGVGQSEVEVMYLADIVTVLLVAGLGDGLQLAKSGLMEIADLYLVHKAARPGSDELEKELQMLIAESPHFQNPDARLPSILKCDSLQGSGVTEVWSWLTKAAIAAAQPAGRERRCARGQKLAHLTLLSRLHQEATGALDEMPYDCSLDVEKKLALLLDRIRARLKTSPSC